MKTLMVICLVALMSDAKAAECRILEHWPDLSRLVCEIETELAHRDADSNLKRRVDLITDGKEIKNIRNAVDELDDDVCRKYREGDFAIPLSRILKHQGLPDAFAKERQQYAAAEIWNESDQGPLTACETQLLKDGGWGPEYQQYYYLKYGSVRERKHLVIRITSIW